MLESFLSRSFSENSRLDEILFDGAQSLCLLSGDERVYRPSPFAENPQWQRDLQTFALKQGTRWDPMQPAAGGAFSLEIKGENVHFRWHGLLPPIARDGVLFSVRRHRMGRFSLEDFAAEAQVDGLREALRGEAPVIVVGPTGSGKTSLLMTLLLEFCAEERLAVIEQIAEIPRLSPRWIRLCARPAGFTPDAVFSLESIVDELMRLRPDRIVIGELRREEVPAFKRALLAGHGSIWTTLHAGHPDQVPLRLAEMSGGLVEEWRSLLAAEGARVLMLQRQQPKVVGLWEMSRDGMRRLV